MTKAERAALLRQTYFSSHPKRPILPAVKKYRERRPEQVNQRPNWRARYGMQAVFRSQKWAKEPDKIEPALMPQTRRIARKSPLIRLAELYPVRLPRRHD